MRERQQTIFNKRWCNRDYSEMTNKVMMWQIQVRHLIWSFWLHCCLSMCWKRRLLRWTTTGGWSGLTQARSLKLCVCCLDFGFFLCTSTLIQRTAASRTRPLSRMWRAWWADTHKCETIFLCPQQEEDQITPACPNNKEVKVFWLFWTHTQPGKTLGINLYVMEDLLTQPCRKRLTELQQVQVGGDDRIAVG